MTPALRASILVTLLALVLGAVLARADWLPNGTPVAAFAGVQMYPNVAADDSGGAFVSWASYGVWPRVQHLTPGGDYAPGWPAEGRTVAIRPRPGGVNEGITLVPDGEGGLYAVWIVSAENCQAHCGFEPSRLWAQRLTPAGAPAPGWPAEGVLVEEHIIQWPLPDVAVARDEGHGILIAWREGGLAIRAQRVSSDGRRLWGSEGLAPTVSRQTPSVPALVGDGKGGAFVFWTDEIAVGQRRSVIGQHVLESGELAWGMEGRAISAAPPGDSGFVPDAPVAVTDGAQGAFVSWAARRGAECVLFAARVTHGGGIPWRGDVAVCPAPGDKCCLRAVPASGGEAILVWLDSRRAPSGGLYAQRLSHGGRTLWTDDGVPVCTAPGSRGPFGLAGDGADGVYLAWRDTRLEGILYATRLTADGLPAQGWPADGALVCARSAVAFPWAGVVSMTAVRGGGAIVAWDDLRYPRPDGPYVEVSSAMLLTPAGPAAAPTGAPTSRGTRAPVVPAGTRVSRTPALTMDARGATVLFSLPDAQPATLELFDVSGRRVWSRDVGGFGAGEHTVRIGDEARLPVGVYLARLRQGARAASARVVVIR